MAITIHINSIHNTQNTEPMNPHLSFPFSQLITIPLQRIQNSSISRLRIVIRIEKQRVVRSAPRIGITNTPDGNPDAFSDTETSIDDLYVFSRYTQTLASLVRGTHIDVVGRRRIGNVQFRDCDFRNPRCS